MNQQHAARILVHQVSLGVLALKELPTETLLEYHEDLLALLHRFMDVVLEVSAAYETHRSEHENV